MDIPVVLRSLKDITNQYDVFLFDQYGVLHDGQDLFENIRETLLYLKSQNKTVSLVSNTSRRSKEASSRLEKLGLHTDLFDFTFTSGELAYEFLKSATIVRNRQTSINKTIDKNDITDVDILANGCNKCCYISFENQNPSFLLDLGIECVDITKADFILLGGSQLLHTGNNNSNIRSVLVISIISLVIQ